MRKLSKKSSLVVAGVSAAALAVSGVAYAYVVSTGNVDSSGGHGTVTPATGTIANVTWSAGSVTGLVPGDVSKNVTVTFSNPNTYSLKIGAHTFSVSSVSGPANCADNTVALLSTTSATPADFIVPAGVSTKTFDVAVSMADSTTIDQSACIGAALDVTFALS